MNFWNRHIGDLIRDTVSLSMLEDGAYNRLLDQYYQT
ncbi:YdaU family protein, partial [Burkholderia pseudomallei]